MIPLSEQEREMDARRSVVVDFTRQSGEDTEGREEEKETEARKIREAWLRKNLEAKVEVKEENEISFSKRECEGGKSYGCGGWKTRRGE